MKKKVDENRFIDHDQIEQALKKIADMGKGLKPEVIDWGNIGKNAVYVARKALAKKCKTCGKTE